MSATRETPITAEGWAKAEALASEYVKREKNPKGQVSVQRYDYAPYLVATWWEGGEAFVLVYGDTIHPERGATALPPYFEFLGPSRLRALKPSQLDRLLGILEVVIPNLSQRGRPWKDNFKDYPDLYPAVVEKDGVIKYVMHYLGGSAPMVPPRGAPPPGAPPQGSRPPVGSPPPPPGGSPPVGGAPSGGAPVITGNLTFQRWSLQLYPPIGQWELEETFERPDPNP